MGAIFFSWRNRHTFVSSILTYQMPFFRLPLCCHLQHGNKNLLNIDGKVQPLLSYHQHPSLTLWTNNNKTGVVTFGTVHQCVCTSIRIQLCIRVIYCSTKSKLFLSCYKASKCCGVWLVNFQEHTCKFHWDSAIHMTHVTSVKKVSLNVKFEHWYSGYRML